MSYRLGADIGGTFTDLVLVDDAGGVFRVGKVLTTSDAPDEGVIEGTRKVLEEAAVDASAVATVIHGTTLFTNALIERKGARTALITTKAAAVPSDGGSGLRDPQVNALEEQAPFRREATAVSYDGERPDGRRAPTRALDAGRDATGGR